MATIREMQTGLYEEVSGIIIGDVTFPYEFWTTWQEYGQNCICRYSFTNDENAVAWFKEKYPAEFAKGVEMRVFDK